jgi:exonuclease SbcC
LQIEGRNGSGKTSILEAIRFVFSESALGYKNRVKNGARSARVTLSFTKDGSKYLVEKELYVDKSSTARMFCNDTLVGDNPTSVHKMMQNLLDENVFDKLLYIPQGGLTTIVEGLSKKEGRKELDSLFGLEKFDRVYKESAEDIKESKLKLDFISEQLARHPKDAGMQYADEMSKLASEKSALEFEIKKYRDEAKALDTEVEKASGKISEIEKVKRQIDQLKDELKKLDVEFARNTTESEGIKQRLEGMSKASAEHARLSKREFEIRKFLDIKELLSKLEKAREKQASMKIDRDRERLITLKGELAGKPDLDKRHSDLEKELRETEGLKAALDHDLRQQESRLQELISLDGKAKCPRCGQVLTPEHLNSEKILGEESVKKLNIALTDIQEKLKKQKDSYRHIKEELSKLEKLDAESKYLKSELEKKEEEEKKLSETLVDLKKKLYEIGYQDEELKFVEQCVDEFNKITGELEMLKEELKQKTPLEEKLKKLASELIQISSQRDLKNTALSQLKYDDVELNSLRVRKEELTQKRYSLSSEGDKKQFRVNEINSKTEEFAKKLDEYHRLKSGKEGQEKKINLIIQAREIFHTDKGIQKYLRDRYITQLNSLLTYYYKRLNENPIYTEIVFDKNYEIQVKTIHGVMSIDQLSGGEKIQLAIALRIALTDMLSHTRILILDEPFGSLDRNHREILGETLNKIASTGQLIVVTHIHVDSLQLERMELGGY